MPATKEKPSRTSSPTIARARADVSGAEPVAKANCEIAALPGGAITGVSFFGELPAGVPAPCELNDSAKGPAPFCRTEALFSPSEAIMMKLKRGEFLKFAGVAVAASLISQVAWAQAYPTKPVRFIHGYVAGGSAEITARLIGQWLSDRLGQPFIVESRPGAGSNIGTEAVVRATPDGYTILLVAPANAINATLYEKLSYNFTQDIAPVAGLIRFPNVMEVNPSVPAQTVPEFIAYAKANPGRINMASSGNGSTIHMSGELFKMMTGVDMVHVPYR